jgi:hypothetical protein
MQPRDPHGEHSASDLFSAEAPELLRRHFDLLRHGSGLSVAVIRERGYRSALGKKGLAELGFGPSQLRPPGWCCRSTPRMGATACAPTARMSPGSTSAARC